MPNGTATILANKRSSKNSLKNRFDIVKEVAPNVMRHRILLNYEGQAEDIRTNEIIDELLKKIPIL